MATAAKSKNKIDKSLYNEIAAIILAAISLLIILCLFTYSPTDDSWNTSSSFQNQNWAGFIGARVADSLIQFSGTFAYFLPFLFLYVAWKIFRSKREWFHPARIFGVILFILAGTGLFTLFGGSGGICGVAVYKVIAGLLGLYGAGIVLVAILLASIILVTNFSFLSLLDSFNMGFENLRIHFNEWLEKRRKRRAAIPRADDSIKNQRVPKVTANESAAQAAVNTSEKSGKSVEPTVSAFELESPYPSIDSQPEITRLEELGRGATDGETDEMAKDVGIPIVPFPTAGQDLAAARSKLSMDEVVANVADESDADEKPAQSFERYTLPSINFLSPAPPRQEHDEEELKETARHLTMTTDQFNVKGEVKNINLGPVVTTYEFKPDPGVKYARVTALSDDLCLALKAESIMIERIPGKAVVGMEIPNKNRETIFLRDVIDSPVFKGSESRLTVALGKAIDGTREIADLARAPHLLIAGATGAGKSVGVNSLIVSILYKARPDEVKFIMVDPKRLELGLYADIPHLATPIITDAKRASIALKWAVTEMENRYKDLAGWGVRDINGYNKEVTRKNGIEDFDDDGNPHRLLPYIVIIIDELADLMMVAGKEVEESIQRLAQMARAVGIHLVLATQRPSVDVITGVIKANFPSRIAFRVSSKIDSRTILDTNGAEKLLGRGDMLFLPPQTSHVKRVHGAFVDEIEIKKIVEHIKKQGNPEYDETITRSPEEVAGYGELPGKGDELYEKALLTVVNNDGASTSLLQRHLRIGYGRAAAILDALAAEGYIGEMDGSKRARAITEKGRREAQEIYEREQQ